MKQTIIMDTAPLHFKHNAAVVSGLHLNLRLFERLTVCHFGDSNGTFKITDEIRDAVRSGKVIFTCQSRNVSAS